MIVKYQILCYKECINERGCMKKIMTVFVLAAVLITSAVFVSFAADDKSAEKTVFNSLSNFFSTFDRPFTRQGNKQNFWNATADWVRNINKE